MSVFTEKVEYLMKRDGITQKRLSELSHISEASIYRYVSGKIEPRIDFIVNIAKVFNESASYFIDENNDSQSHKDAYQETHCIVARNKEKLTAEQKNDIIKTLLGMD